MSDALLSNYSADHGQLFYIFHVVNYVFPRVFPWNFFQNFATLLWEWKSLCIYLTVLCSKSSKDKLSTPSKVMFHEEKWVLRDRGVELVCRQSDFVIKTWSTSIRDGNIYRDFMNSWHDEKLMFIFTLKHELD